MGLIFEILYSLNLCDICVNLNNILILYTYLSKNFLKWSY